MKNLKTGQLVELYISNGTTIGKIFMDGTYIHVPMFFILDANIGDTVTIESGIATSIYRQEEEVGYEFAGAL